MIIRIATRRSALALWQAQHVATLLRAMDLVDDVELVALSTRGDETLDRSLQKIGGKGLFIKELEVAMRERRADIAVHSMKDVPVEMPAEFCIPAVLKRANYADALLTRDRQALHELSQGAVIGTSSLRRQAQLYRLRPDLQINALRGNVNTRLAKLDSGDYDGIVLAAAGLERLQLAARISHTFSTAEMLPAAAQGVIGIECRQDDARMCDLIAKLDHGDTRLTTVAERAIATTWQADCQSPVAAFATLDGNTLALTALVAMPDGSRCLRDTISGNASAAEHLAVTLAERMAANGGREILVAAGVAGA